MRARLADVTGLLLAATVADAVLAAFLRTHQIYRFINGNRDLYAWLGPLGALSLLVVLAAVATVVYRLWVSRRSVEGLTVSGSDWYWESDEHLVVTYSSESVSNLLGYAPSEVVAKALFEFLPEEDADRLRVALARALSDHDGWENRPLRWQHADGRLVPLLGSAVPIKGDDGRIIGFRGTRHPSVATGSGTRFADVARARVQDVLAGGTVDIALQPIVDLRARSLRGAEALARFPDGRSPGAWFNDAQQAGLTVELELMAATAAIHLLPQLDHLPYVSVNASPQLIVDRRFAALLKSAGDLQRIVVELTEHAAVAKYETLAGVLDDFRRRGLRVAVDDTGAGYASFNHVLQLHPDIIKIDRSVVARTLNNAAARALVSAIVRLAAEMDAVTVGEGVESEHQLRTLHILGLHCAQGYAIAPPTTDVDVWTSWADARGVHDHATA